LKKIKVNIEKLEKEGKNKEIKHTIKGKNHLQYITSMI